MLLVVRILLNTMMKPPTDLVILPTNQPNLLGATSSLVHDHLLLTLAHLLRPIVHHHGKVPTAVLTFVRSLRTLHSSFSTGHTRWSSSSLAGRDHHVLAKPLGVPWKPPTGPQSILKTTLS